MSLDEERASFLPEDTTASAPQRQQRRRALLWSLLAGATLLLVSTRYLPPSAAPELAPPPVAQVEEALQLEMPALQLETPVLPAPEDKGFNLLPLLPFSPDELKEREWSWTYVLPHASLQRHLDLLAPADNATRNWLLESRLASTAGTGLRLGAELPQASKLVPPHGVPRDARFAKPIYAGGDPAKHKVLVQEWESGMIRIGCPQDVWQDEYAQLHSDMMLGLRKPSLLEYSCEGICGGFADRLLGISTTILYSILSGRAFSIRWAAPQPPFDQLFDSPWVDWSQPYSNSTYHPLYSDPALLASRKTVKMINWGGDKLDEWLAARHPQKWIKLALNRGGVMRLFRKGGKYEARLAEMGLEKTGAFSCIMQYALRPKKDILRHILSYTSFFALPQIFTVGIQIRTGDKSFTTEGMNASTVETHRSFFECADKLAARFARPDQKILFYLVSDSEHLKESALAAFPDRVMVSGLTPKHLEKSLGQSHPAAGVANAIAEIWAFARGTDYRVITGPHSGFGKLATYLSGVDGRTVMNSKGVDCGSQSAFTSMETLASTWSLG